MDDFDSIHLGVIDEMSQFKFVDETQRTRRPQVAACYYCRFKKVKCTGEKPNCSRCKSAKVPCHYPPATRRHSQAAPGSSTAAEESTSRRTRDRNVSETSSTSTSHDVMTEGPTAAAPKKRKDNAGGQTSIMDFDIIDNFASNQDMLPPGLPDLLEGSPNDNRHVAGFEDSTVPTSQPSLYHLDTMAIGALEPPPDLSTFSPIFSDASFSQWSSPRSGLAAAQQSLSAFLEDQNSISKATTAVSSSSGYTCPDDGGCNAVVISILDNISGWRQLDSLLETISAIRSVLRQLDSLAECLRCQNESTFIMLLLILAEKLLDQISDLSLSKKTLTSGDSRKSSLSFGEYQLETDEEQWVVYSGLLSHNIYLLQTILSRLSNHVKTMKWHNHSETLNLLLIRSTSLNKNIRHYAK